MRPFAPSRRLGLKVSLLAVGSSLVSALALIALAAALSAGFNDLALREVDQLVDEDLSHVTTSAYNLVRAEDAAVGEFVAASLAVTRRLFERAGGLRLARGLRTWNARDQFTGASREFVLPRAFLGSGASAVELAGADGFESFYPVVDEASELLGATATVFQRANEEGDMLRVATTVRTAEGRRAVGTYIPARAADGMPNAVIAEVLAGKEYRGRAYVVNDWYLTAYEPIRDPDGRIAGMLYVGISQKSAEARIRAAIIGLSLGKTGYVFVISGTGADRGAYVISQGGARDGENLWDIRDPDGRFVTREIVESAIALEPGAMTTIKYRWLNPGDTAPRWKVARLAYFAPWDWVIGASVYEDELDLYRGALRKGNARLVATMVFAGLAMAAAVGLVGIGLARGMTGPLRKVTLAAEALARGEAGVRADVSSRDELGILAASFNFMSDRIESTLAGLRESEEKYRGIFENAIEGIFRTGFDGRLLRANPSLARILGYDSPEELLSTVTDVGSQVYSRLADRMALLEELRAADTAIGKETPIKRKDGREHWVAISARAVRDDAGCLLFIDGFLVDIDARKKAEDALLRGRERLEELVVNLGSANRELQGLLEEREAILKEVHHRVKNNLQVISSMAGLQSNSERDFPAAAALERFRNRVLSMAVVHEQLYLSSDFGSVDFRAVVSDLVASLGAERRQGPNGDAPPPVSNEVEDLVLPVDMAIPLALAVEETLSNSFDHAFPTSWEGPRQVAVRLVAAAEAPGATGSTGAARSTAATAATASAATAAAAGPPRRVIEIHDTGIGFPAGFRAETSSGLGLRLAFAAMAQIGGSLLILQGEGGRVRLEFPAPNPTPVPAAGRS